MQRTPLSEEEQSNRMVRHYSAQEGIQSGRSSSSLGLRYADSHRNQANTSAMFETYQQQLRQLFLAFLNNNF